MSEQEPNTSQRVDGDKAWAMAHAEQPHRNAVIEAVGKGSKLFEDRYGELKSQVESGDISEISANEDEISYYNEINGIDNTHKVKDLRPLDTVTIAKKLVEDDNWHSLRARKSKGGVDRFSHPSDTYVTANRVPIDGEGVDKRVLAIDSEKPIDRSRTTDGDKAAELASNLYDIVNPNPSQHQEDKVQ